jgi:hypothetical protein
MEFLRSEALQGNLYTKQTASEKLEKEFIDLGSAKTIKSYIDTLSTFGDIKYSKENILEDTKLPNRSDGYLILEEMEFCKIDNETGEISDKVIVEPTHFKNENNGLVEKIKKGE